MVFSRWRKSFSLESRRCPRVPPLRSSSGGGEGPPIPSSRGASSRVQGPAMPPSPPGAFTGRTGPLPVSRVCGPLACLPEFSRTIHAFAAHPSSLLSAQLEFRVLDNSVSLTSAPHVSQVCFRPDFSAPTSRPRMEEFSRTTSSSSTFEGVPGKWSPRYDCPPCQTHPNRLIPHATSLTPFSVPCAFALSMPLSGSVYPPGSSTLRRGEGRGPPGAHGSIWRAAPNPPRAPACSPAAVDVSSPLSPPCPRRSPRGPLLPPPARHLAPQPLPPTPQPASPAPRAPPRPPRSASHRLLAPARARRISSPAERGGARPRRHLQGVHRRTAV